MWCFGRLVCHRQEQSEDMFDASCHLCITITTLCNILGAAMFSADVHNTGLCCPFQCQTSTVVVIMLYASCIVNVGLSLTSAVT